MGRTLGPRGIKKTLSNAERGRRARVIEILARVSDKLDLQHGQEAYVSIREEVLHAKNTCGTFLGLIRSNQCRYDFELSDTLAPKEVRDLLFEEKIIMLTDLLELSYIDMLDYYQRGGQKSMPYFVKLLHEEARTLKRSTIPTINSVFALGTACSSK